MFKICLWQYVFLPTFIAFEFIHMCVYMYIHGAYTWQSAAYTKQQQEMGYISMHQYGLVLIYNLHACTVTLILSLEILSICSKLICLIN